MEFGEPKLLTKFNKKELVRETKIHFRKKKKIMYEYLMAFHFPYKDNRHRSSEDLNKLI